MAKLYGKLGQLVRLLKTQLENEQYGDPPEFDEVIEFDGATNQDVINGLDTDWNSHSVVDGQLLRSGVSVTINPPGEEWIADETAVSSRTGWKDLGNWSTWEAQQAQDYVNAEIRNGWDKTTIDDWIDSNVTNIATAKTALKLLAGNIITIRAILGIISKVILYIRDILIKKL